MSTPLFHDDAYLGATEATVTGIDARGGIALDRTVFYPTGGGQPGDSGRLVLDDGTEITIATTIYDADRKTILHVPASPPAEGLLAPGRAVRGVIDWERRFDLMRTHTCLHLLCSLIPAPVTGGAVEAARGRLDFDVPEAILEKEELTARLQALIAGDHEVSSTWITDAELDANPGLVRTMSVQPPRGSGRVRLVRIGEVDLQPCGGTHVRSTREIGTAKVTKIEKKGALNRRIRVELT
ncbi:MAG: alanyl-tRNA editing protein [Rhizobiales bacterium]|nr:alanyl-tRNA editing protein [Hyphomicrobiales bacterium]